MGQPEVSETAELSATEAAERLLPLLKEFAAKMSTISEHATVVMAKFVSSDSNSRGIVQFVTVGENAVTPAALEAGRLICSHDALDKPVTDLAREASGLIEHAALEHYLRAETKLRLDELEEHIKYSAVMIGELVRYLTAQKGQAERVRKLIEKSGRYKAPF